MSASPQNTPPGNAHAPEADLPRGQGVAVCLPCLNEEVTIGKVVDDFRRALPEAAIYVFDNNSTDRTAEIARAHGAKVITERRPGKGWVVQAMFRRVEADCYLMADGDDTYDADAAPRLVQLVQQGAADMVVGTRLSEFTQGSFRALHVLGNHVITGTINRIFQQDLKDMLSGYRVLSRDLAKALPLLSPGFEIETELTIRTLEYGFTILEVPLPYRERPEGSVSKLNTWKDGLRVLRTIGRITRSYRPLLFFSLLAAVFFIAGALAGVVVVEDYMVDRYVNRVPLAILATGCMIVSALSAGIGVLLDTVNERFKELARTIIQRGP